MLFQRDAMAEQLWGLANGHGFYAGTSSWKYPGWCGTLYDEELYLYNHKFSKGQFERNCLVEYAKVFPTVCVDATYYRFPKQEYFEELAAQVPDGFRFSFKVPDDITIKTYPNAGTFGGKAGQGNPDFLDYRILKHVFLRRLEAIRPKVGLLIFEFSHFHAEDFAHGRDFVDALDGFFTDLPKDWQYAVEVRNRNLLHPDYFAMLRRHGVAHLYNQWTHMPPVLEQMAVHPLNDNPFIAARFLLTPGHTQAWTEERFSPYHQIHELDADARKAMIEMFAKAGRKALPNGQPSYLFVGNHLEGNALHTLSDVMGASGLWG